MNEPSPHRKQVSYNAGLFCQHAPILRPSMMQVVVRGKNGIEADVRIA
ncbi:hypothetical protein ACFSKL_11700 [Belliella marina]|uniref:Uncharacterized protein n=1 Tax=Belliella marina TaxID=1644146 RepID=A0ABW4VRQ1_9BACT